MAAVNAFADIVERILEGYAKTPYAHGDLTCEAIFDRPRGRFALITLGWDDEERVHHPLVHVDIVADTLWIQTDNTEHGIAPELVQAGIPKSNIVLAFRPPDVRQHTDYAVA